MISVETGQVLKTDVIVEWIEDQINYAEYNGNHRDLFPNANASTVEKRALDNLLNARKNIKPTSTLIQEINNRISNSVKNHILDYEKSRP